MSATELSPALFEIFTNLIEQTCGLHYDSCDRELFTTKLIAHATEHGHDALLDYYYRLRYDDPDGVEITRLIDALLVHETYFFRELPTLIQLVDTHLAPVVRTRGQARVWSAACSTGEEPYSLAMLLDDRGLLDRVEIIGTDVSAQAIDRARAGRSSPHAVRSELHAPLVDRYLDVTASQLVVTQHIREAVQFFTMNLVADDQAGRIIGSFDAILCRNVLIYFNKMRSARVVDRLVRRLVPDGLLAVGVSESLLRFGTGLVCEDRGGSLFYRRAG